VATGQYCKHFTIVNDDSSIFSKGHSSPIYDARVVIYDHNIFMILAAGLEKNTKCSAACAMLAGIPNLTCKLALFLLHRKASNVSKNITSIEIGYTLNKNKSKAV
jgi:hypothetical protein